MLIGCLAILPVTGEHRLIMSIRPGTWASSISLWGEFLALMDNLEEVGAPSEPFTCEVFTGLTLPFFDSTKQLQFLPVDASAFVSLVSICFASWKAWC